MAPPQRAPPFKRARPNKVLKSVTVNARSREFLTRLLDWGHSHRRSFPWRQTRDPYAILVAELLLQRTAARQVLPVFSRFLIEFPNPMVLSGASLNQIKEIIASLGLPSRASRLRSTARLLLKRHCGKVPTSEKELKNLPGVGRYAANAILCFAFDRDVPIVDTNVARIMKRVLSLRVGEEPHKQGKLWNLMRRILPSGRAREFNLSLLDLAHEICRPRNPRCEICPVNDYCNYYRRSKLLLDE